MSITYRTYVGPYLQCSTTQHDVDEWDMREALRDRLTTPGGDAYRDWMHRYQAHIWVGNVAIPNQRNFGLEEYTDFALTDIDATQADTEMVQFTLFFGSEINLLQEAYGRDVVRVRWGVIQDYL